jgi:hypothetical protein
VELDKKKKKVATTVNEENTGYEECQKIMEEGGRVINCSSQTNRTSSRQNKANIMRSKDFLW